MGAGNELGLYGWRAMHASSANGAVNSGYAATETQAIERAEKAMNDDRAVLAEVVPIGWEDGRLYTGPPLMGVRALSGRIKWWHPATGQWSYSDRS